MKKDDFEGTRILEKLVETGDLDAFYEAVDADNWDEARHLLRAAGISADEIAVVRKMLRDGDEH